MAVDIQEYLENAYRLPIVIEMYNELLQKVKTDRIDFDRINKGKRDESSKRLVAEYHTLYDSICERITGHLQRAQQKLDHINSMIDQVEPPIIGDILRLFYVERKTQVQIEQIVYYAPATQRKKLKIGLAQMQKIMDHTE